MSRRMAGLSGSARAVGAALALAAAGLPGSEAQAQGLVLSPAAPSAARGSSDLDLDAYYRFPVSIGVEYRSLSWLSSFAAGFTAREFAAEARLPLSGAPTLQPFARGGALTIAQVGSTGAGPWDHSEFYGALGLAWSRRLARNFELGLDLSAGLGQSYFPNLVPGGPVGSLGASASLGARIGLVPSYSLAVDIRPSLRWSQSLGPLTEFDGLAFGLGFSVSYRFGEDPDSPVSAIRALRFEKADIPPAFSSMQSYYSKHPIGRVTVVNTERQTLTDLEVSFYQAGYMDAPTPSFSAARVPAGASLDVPLKAVFNAQVYKLTGGFKPLSGEIVATYRLGGRAVEQRSTVTYDLYDKTAMTWDDDRKAAAFITTLDSALQNYAAFINESGKQAQNPGVNKALQDAMLTYNALRAIGMFYQEDPTAPFTRVQSEKTLVDFISLPRLTLKRRYGDCKNLTVLFCSLLESRGIRTGFITVPGHLFPVFDTGLGAAAWQDLAPDRSMTIAIDGTLWVPVEITMLDGRSDFLAAWRKAVEEWSQNEPSRALYRTGEAQALYSPVAVEDQDLGLQYGSAEEITKLFSRDLDAQAAMVIGGYAAAAESSRDKKDFNRLGATAARLGRLQAAEEAFAKALKIDPKYPAALVNLGNAAFLKKDYKRAVETYKTAMGVIGQPDKGGVASATQVALLFNLSRAYAAQRDQKQADAFLAQATALDPERVRVMTAQAPASGAGTRASSAAETALPQFAED